MNTSCNFVVTAVLGSAIFSESLPPLWWLGASLLVAGNVIIGRKDESAGAEAGVGGTAAERPGSSDGALLDDEGRSTHSMERLAPGSESKARRGGEDEDILDLGISE